MKTLFSVMSVLLLCSCAAAPTLQTTLYGNTYRSGPTSIDDPRLRAPQFYMDDDKSPVEPAGAPQSFRFHAIDPFCASNCQTSRHSQEYCNRACGI